MMIQLNYDITLSTFITNSYDDPRHARLRFKVTATSKETLQDGAPIKHEGVGDNFNDAFAEVEDRLLLEYQAGQRPS